MKAQLYIPACGCFEDSLYDNLPDDMVMIFGRMAALSLSDGMYVVVTFSDGSVRTIEA